MWRTIAVTLALACCLSLLGVKAQERRVYALWQKAALADQAAVFASRYDRKSVRTLRFVDLGAVAPLDRPRALQTLGYVVNSWSSNDLMVLPQEVPGTEGALAWFDLANLRNKNDGKGLEKLIAAFDRLGELGSGASPFPEPYYHVVEDVVTEDRVEEVKGWSEWRTDQYGRRYRVEQVTRRIVKGKTARKVALGPHLNKGTVIGLSALTETAFPVFEYHWLLANGLSEPRYHELLGLDDTEASAKRLAAVDRRTADEVGAQVRGAVLFSEVAHHNRLLERTPTLQRYGRGSYQESYDFKSSVRVQDVLKDLLIEKPDAKEIIWTLPNGLLGFFVVDGEGKRLDKADADVALNNRTRLRDRQVRTAFHCIDCHLRDRGWIEVDDEVRALATKPVTLISDSFTKADRRRGERIRQKYLTIDYNELLQADQALVEVAVAAATRGESGPLSCPQVAKSVVDAIYAYSYEPVSLRRLSLELGCPQDEVKLALQTKGVDPVFVVLRAGRPARRDKIEAGFAQVAFILYEAKK